MTTNPVLTHAVVGLACLIGGFLLGRAERAWQAGRPPRERWANIARLVTAAVLIGLAVFLVVTERNQSACYRGYFTGVSTALAERSAATGEEASAQREFLLEIRSGDAADPAALDRYLSALDRLETARRNAPIPQPPDCR